MFEYRKFKIFKAKIEASGIRNEEKSFIRYINLFAFGAFIKCKKRDSKYSTLRVDKRNSR